MSHRSASCRPGRRALGRGFTLLETLVALVVFSIGLLGIVGLQARAVQFSVDGEDRNRAALLADEIVATMWANNTVSLTSAVVDAWEARVAGTLRSGAGTVSAPDSNGVVTVTVTWRPPSRATAESDASYSTKVIIP